MTTDAETLVPMADLATEWGVTSNTVSRRLSFLGIKPIRQGNFRFLTAEQKALGDQLQDHVLSGKPMEAFPRPDGDSSQVVRRVSSQVTPQVAAQVEIAAAMAAALQPAPDPLMLPRGLAEAARDHLVLTTDQLAALGVKGVDGFADGDEAYGYRFSKHRQRNRTLWTVELSIGGKTLKQLSDAVDQRIESGRQVGFTAHLTDTTTGISALFAATTIG